MQFSQPHHLTDVVAPRQEKHTCVVLFPMRQDEGEQHHPKDVVKRGHAHAAGATPKYRIDCGHEKDASPAVQPVVKQLPEWRGGVGAARLLAVHAVCTDAASRCAGKTNGRGGGRGDVNAVAHRACKPGS